MTTSAALSSVPAVAAPTSDHGSPGSPSSSAPGFLTAVGVEILKMRRLRAPQVTMLIVGTSVALCSMNLFSASFTELSHDPHTMPWARLLLMTSFFNAMTGPVLVSVLASRQTDIEHTGSGWNLAAASGLTPGTLCRAKLTALSLLIVPAVTVQSLGIIILARFRGLSVALDVGPWATYTTLLICVDLAMCTYFLWLAAVVDNQLIVMSTGLLSGFIGIFTLLVPPEIVQWTPWGYYALITPVATSSSAGSQRVVTYIDVPAGWIAGFLILTVLLFTVVTHRLNRIER
ncbi:ABC transporter permease [Actinomyces sp.]|uniref:ABC transporter permease n=1 Tax=Actinomyces sp. TaxID=29317 RepID=UPI0026DC7D0C|nr:ABC transporter permease [Actinomyces sp.]MDO4655722.1 ABC transporter permease [Actinomyces sp.]